MHQAGQVQEAEAIYRQVLDIDPDHADANHLLGILLAQLGDHAHAVELISRAIAMAPDRPMYHNNLGNVLQELGPLDDALASYGRALAIQPAFAEAHNNLGIVLAKSGRLEEAVASYHKALAIKPHYAEAHHALGNTLADLERRDDALASYRRALAIKPDYAEAHNNMGNVLRDLERLDDALASYRRALAIKPDFAKAHNNLGIALANSGRLEEAVASYRRALAIKPDYVEAHSNLGNVLQKLGRLVDALASCERALAIKPDFAEAHSNLGIVLANSGRLEEAAASYREALAIKPDYADAHHNFSLVLLLRGDFPNGFEQYEWRFGTKMCPRRVFAQPEWDGGPFPGKTLLLHAEQGLGDTLHFIRYAPLVRELGGRVVVECQKPLARLLGSVAGIDALVPKGDPLPPFDLHAPLLSLPRLLGTTVATVPAAVPYLAPEPGAVDVWRHRLGRGEELKVGLVWAGNPGHKNDRNRSIPLERLQPLLDVPGIRFFALQVGERASDIEAVGLHGCIDDISPDLNDFADTVAALSVLDLLISVDTAAAHLMGALDRPVWLLLPFLPDWRWMMDREDSPWYPTMRLFRQPTPSDWLSAIHRMSKELAALVGGATVEANSNDGECG